MFAVSKNVDVISFWGMAQIRSFIVTYPVKSQSAFSLISDGQGMKTDGQPRLKKLWYR